MGTDPTTACDTEIGVEVLTAAAAPPAALVRVLGSGQVAVVALPDAAAARALDAHRGGHAVLAGRGAWAVDPTKFFRPVRMLWSRATGYRLLDPLTPGALDRLAAAARGAWDGYDFTRPFDEQDD